MKRTWAIAAVGLVIVAVGAGYGIASMFRAALLMVVACEFLLLGIVLTAACLGGALPLRGPQRSMLLAYLGAAMCYVAMIPLGQVFGKAAAAALLALGLLVQFLVASPMRKKLRDERRDKKSAALTG